MQSIYLPSLQLPPRFKGQSARLIRVLALTAAPLWLSPGVKATSVIATPNVGAAPNGVAANTSTDRIYITNNGANTVTVLDGAASPPVAVATINVGASPTGVGVNSVTNRVYVANSGSNTVSMIDPTTTPPTVATVNVGASPMGVGVNAATNRVYVANMDSNTVSIIDPSTAPPTVTSVIVGGSPVGVAVNSTTNKIYVANSGSNSLSVLDGSTSPPTVSTVNVGAVPQGVAVDEAHNRVYVTNSGANTVTAIDGSTRSVIGAPINVGGTPLGATVNGPGRRLYVADSGLNNVSIIDTTGDSNLVVETINVGAVPTGAGLDSSTARVYITNNGSNTTSVLAPASATQLVVTAPATVGDNIPFSVTVSVLDGSNNPAIGYRGSIHFTSSDGAATLPADYTFTYADAGVHTFANAATLRTLGSKTITATTTTGPLFSNFATVNVVPAISGFTPSSGHVGTTVTISGGGFTGATSVTFNGTGSSYAVNSDTTITASVPYGATTGPISVTVPAGTATSASSFTVLPPVITSFNPTAGSLGAFVTITGSGFTGATAVNFNGAASSYAVNSDTNITTYVPYAATTGPISITTPAGTGTSATNFTVNAPTITSFNPNNGSVGTTVNITGSAFTAASSVTFNGVGANYVLNSDTSITATVPFGATTGRIKVTSPAGTGISATNFTVNPPTITSFSPTSGPIGSFVTLTGSSFTGVTAVKFGSVSANFFYSSDTQINATVPPGFVSGLISVITPAGTGDTSALTPANFTVPGPVITNLNPNNGSLRSMVVINGSGFTSATAVTFNGVSANYYINLDTQIVAFVPDTATTGPVTVTTPSGTSAGVTFTVNPPVITGFNPTHGSIGSFVNISGSGFTLASGVKFGGVTASFFVSTDTSISAQVPSGFVSGTISVTGPIGTGTSAGTFTVDAPSITGFSPTHGAAGTNVTVNGSSFTGATSIKFNGVAASLFVSNDGQISTTVPVGATTGPITVTGPGGTGTSATNFAVP